MKHIDIQKRNERIKLQLDKGASIKEIADLTGLSVMRIYQIKNDYKPKKEEKLEIVVPAPNFLEDMSRPLPEYDAIGASAEVRNSPRFVSEMDEEVLPKTFALTDVKIIARKDYRVTDIHLAAALYTIGYEITSVESLPNKPSFKEFVFKWHKDIAQHVELFRQGILQLPARDLLKNWRAVKAMTI